MGAGQFRAHDFGEIQGWQCIGVTLLVVSKAGGTRVGLWSCKQAAGVRALVNQGCLAHRHSGCDLHASLLVASVQAVSHCSRAFQVSRVTGQAVA